MNYMSIVEYMSFELSWFTTLPGIAVTIGVLCLVVGVILWIVGGKKKKDEVEETTTDAKPATEENVAAPAAVDAATVQEEVKTEETAE